MKQQLFVVYDLKSKTTCSQIIVAQDEYVCKRNLQVYASSLSPTIKACPGDFAVIHLGEFQDEIPAITPSEDAKQICFSMTEVVDYADIGKQKED